MPMPRPAPAHKRNTYVSVMRLKPSAVPDASGHVDESDPNNWEKYISAWCNVSPRGSREFFRREQVAADITHAVEMLWSPEADGISPKMRLTFNGRNLNIAEPARNVDENNHTLVFACTEVKEGS